MSEIGKKSEPSYKFELSLTEAEEYQKWRDSLPVLEKGYFGTIGGGYWFTFTPTGIGVVVVVGRSDVPKYDKDITDYDSW